MTHNPAAVVICPTCMGERRVKGGLCPQCHGAAQIRSMTAPSPPPSLLSAGELERLHGFRLAAYDDKARMADPAGAASAWRRYEDCLVELAPRLIAAARAQEAQLADLRAALEEAVKVSVNIQEAAFIYRAERDDLRAQVERLLVAGIELVEQVETDEEHGAGADDLDCPICAAIRDMRAALIEPTREGRAMESVIAALPLPPDLGERK